MRLFCDDAYAERGRGGEEREAEKFWN